MALERSPRPVSVTVSERSHFEYRVSGSVDVGVVRVRVCTCTFTRGPCCLAHDSPIFGLGLERLNNAYTQHDVG